MSHKTFQFLTGALQLKWLLHFASNYMSQVSPFNKVPISVRQHIYFLTRNFNLNTSQPASDLKLWFTISFIEAIDCADGFQLDLATCNDIFTTLCGDSCLVSIDDVSYGGSVIHGCGKYDVKTSNGSADIPPTVSFNPVGLLHYGGDTLSLRSAPTPGWLVLGWFSPV
jgi:hypothetical protein